MDYVIAPLPFAVCMLAGMLICLEVGRRMGKSTLAKDPQGSASGIGVVQGAVFSLFGLLIAFTFSGAPGRLDARRHLIQDEANAIGTAYLRLDLLPPGSQPAMRERFRNYVDSRLAAYRKFPNVQAVKAELSRSARLQSDIWTQTLAASRLPDGNPDALKLLVPSLNEMFDISSSRTMATAIHPPPIIFALLFVLALVCSSLAGYGMAGSKKHSWLHITAFAVTIVISIYVVLEIEYPRMGLLSVETEYDQVLVDVRESMK
jgi:hypothetical protein